MRGDADLKSSTKAEVSALPFGVPGASARIPSTALEPTSSDSPGETSWSLPQAIAGFHPKLLESDGASWEKPDGFSTRRTASGPLLVIWDTWEEWIDEELVPVEWALELEELLSGGGASTICAPTVPSSPCQAWMKSWVIVSALGSAFAATFTLRPS